VNIFYNGQPLPTRDQITVAELVEQLELPVRQIAVEVNCELAPREQYAQQRLHEGDRVEVVTLAGGG
jgi:sulfur carrier protein